MRYTVSQILGDEPVLLEEIEERVHALPGNTDDERYTLTPMITAAREYCENLAGYAFVRQRIIAYPDPADLAAGFVNLPRPPIVEVESVMLYAGDGTSTTTDGYELDGEDGRLYLPVDGAGLRRVNPVAVQYIAGADECPELARQAMMLLIGHWYQNRESVQTGAVTAVEIEQTTKAILKQYKRWW